MVQRLTSLAASLLVLGSAAVGSAQAVAKCAAVRVSSAAETGGRAASRFSATRTVDLTFTVVMPEALGAEHVVELRVFTPNGFLYQTIAVPTTGEAKAGQVERRLPGYPHPVEVRRVRVEEEKGLRYYAVDVAFPVAGTSIVSSSLYGRWSVEVYLDGDDAPCSRARRFVLTE